MFVARFHENVDRASTRRVLGRVREKIVDDVTHMRWVGPYGTIRVGGEEKPLVFGRRGQRMVLNGRTGHVGEAEVAPLELELPILASCDDQQTAHGLDGVGNEQAKALDDA